MVLLQISKGSASQGLRALRQLGAISSTYAPGDRKEICCRDSLTETGQRLSSGTGGSSPR